MESQRSIGNLYSSINDINTSSYKNNNNRVAFLALTLAVRQGHVQQQQQQR